MATTIDFASLMRKEKQKAKQKRSQPTAKANKSDTSESTDSMDKKKNLSQWSPSEGPLTLERLNLKNILQDPKTVYYSSQSINNLQSLEEWLKNLPIGDSGLSEWKTMKYGK